MGSMFAMQCLVFAYFCFFVKTDLVFLVKQDLYFLCSVKSVKPNQLSIDIQYSRIHGRVHVTQLVDVVEEVKALFLFWLPINVNKWFFC